MTGKPRTIDEYLTGKGTIRFPADSPMPATLVRKLVRTRVAQHGFGRAAAPAGAPRRR